MISRKAFTLTLLFLNSIGAIFGGYTLIANPDGSGFGIPLSALQYSPFPDFLIPGIVLFATIGIGSFVAFVAVLRSVGAYPWYVIAEGVLLSGWIIIEVLFLREVAALHLIYLTVGIVLIALGYNIVSNPTSPQPIHQSPQPILQKGKS